MSRKINIKVCGLTRLEDMTELEMLGVQYGGIIFYEKSPRFAREKLDPEKVRQLKRIKKVGVFVNADKAYILEQKEKFGLEMVQLHGDETPDFCSSIRKYIPVIKAFRMNDEKDLKSTKQYAGVSDFFLFDAPGKLYGGNGTLFNWELLKNYEGNIPFFISGGIGLSEAEQVMHFSHPALHAVDINSRFEIRPGEKKINEIKQFVCHLNSD